MKDSFILNGKAAGFEKFMKDQRENGAKIEEIIDREIERHPHNRNLLEAFRPVMIERKRILAHLQLSNTEPFRLDNTRFHNGVSVMGQYSLFREEDPFEDLARATISSIAKGFPDLEEDLKHFENALCEKKIPLHSYFESDEDAREDLLRAWSETYALPQALMGLVLHQVTRIILEKRGRILAEQIKNAEWDKGYCPICGTFPSLALIGEKIGERWLHCSGCGHDWRFSRVICPYCGHEGQEGMNFFLIEGREQESAFTCDRCRRYLITLNRVSGLNDRNLDVSALGLVHLDMIMQEKNFAPMAETGWNVF